MKQTQTWTSGSHYSLNSQGKNYLQAKTHENPEDISQANVRATKVAAKPPIERNLQKV